MSEAPMRLDVFGQSDVGRVRENNEDHFLTATCQKSLTLGHTNLTDTSALQALSRAAAHVFIVADGVGGAAGGELASGTAVNTVTQVLSRAMECYYQFDVQREHEFLDRLEGAVRQAHETVVAAYGGGGRGGAATTLTMAVMVWPRIYTVHVGDSRGYVLRQGQLKRFTKDQTMAEALVERGALPADQADRSPLANVLSSAVGGEIEPLVGLLDLAFRDVLLLCTDGLTKHVPDDVIAETLRTGASAEAMCRSLVEAALDGGGTDNVTAIVARMLPEA